MATFHFRPAIALSAVLSGAGAASAQSFNLDCGSVAATAPSSAYGAALGQVGHWNAVRSNWSAPPVVLKDLAGADTAARVSVFGCDNSVADDPNIDGDHAALLEDWQNGDCYADPQTMHFTGLLPGTYIVTPYAYSVENPTLTTTFWIHINSVHSGSVSVQGIVFPGSFVGFPLPRLAATLQAGDTLTLFTGGTNYNGIAGLQLTRLEGITPYCFGDLGDCPCSVGAFGNGCPTSLQAGGTGLSGLGTPSVSADDVVLMATGVSNTVVTLFQGTQLAGGGRGLPFGDGLRCASGTVIRIASKLASGNTMVYPEAGELPVSVRGALPSTGGLRTYQVWHRNAADFCTPATFNLTNGLAIQWL